MDFVKPGGVLGGPPRSLSSPLWYLGISYRACVAPLLLLLLLFRGRSSFPTLGNGCRQELLAGAVGLAAGSVISHPGTRRDLTLPAGTRLQATARDTYSKCSETPRILGSIHRVNESIPVKVRCIGEPMAFPSVLTVQRDLALSCYMTRDVTGIRDRGALLCAHASRCVTGLAWSQHARH